jgi:hypothetical protein
MVFGLAGGGGGVAEGVCARKPAYGAKTAASAKVMKVASTAWGRREGAVCIGCSP